VARELTTKSTRGRYAAPEDITREKLLDAGIACLDQYGLKKTNMRLIAQESGIVRQTVYNYFNSKYELLSAAFQREGIRLGEDASRHIERFQGAEDKLVEGFLFIYETFPKNPILSKVLEPGQDFMGTVGLSSVPFAFFGELVFHEVFEQHPYLRPDIANISELWIRNVMSFLIVSGPDSKTREEMEHYVRRYLLPGVGLQTPQPT
jgi:AcrR family transcriptional regulator